MNFENDVEEEHILTVEDIMTKDVIMAPENCTVTEIAQMIVQNDVGSILIEKEQENLFPEIVTKTDILRLIGRGDDPNQVKVRKIASGPVITCHLSTSVEKAMRIMTKQTIKRLVVVDKNREIQGIISTSDVIKAAPGLVEVAKSKAKIMANAVQRDRHITGYCDQCGNYSERLIDMGGYAVCKNCREMYYESENYESENYDDFESPGDY